MEVTDVQTFLVSPDVAKNWLFVKVETDEGIHGWGECYTQADRDRAIEAHVHELGRIAPHNYNSTTIGLAATLQVCAVMPNFLITEYFVNFTECGDVISLKPIEVEDGYICLRDSSGLGLELDEDGLAQFPYRQSTARHLRQFSEEGP